MPNGTPLGESDLAVARYTNSGALDPTFDGDGLAVTVLSQWVWPRDVRVAIDGSSRPLVSGGTVWDF